MAELWPLIRGALTVLVLIVMTRGVIEGVRADDWGVITLSLLGLPVAGILWSID